ncbi:MAG TPA: prolyl oligopeptidase family serine peptidase [Candidatus Kapabacteria bacterium]|nr:prolyl oligopeptidase family serine peptidase [Candidatus Kapabacteria bacterium]
MKFLALLLVWLLIRPVYAQKLVYPATKRIDQVDTYFGTRVVDPYRWLENVDSADVHTWVKAENKVTNAYLARIPYRAKLRARLEQLLNYPRISAPHKVGPYYFFFKNNGLQNQAVLYRQKGLTGTPEVFLDPNTLSSDGTASMGDMAFSHDDKYLAYSIQKSGSDWQEMFVKEVATGKQLSDHLQWVRYSSAAWYKDGFFYERYDEPTSGQYTASADFQKVYYHKLGNPQSVDSLVYQDLSNKERVFGISTTEDEKYIFLYISEGGKIGSLISWKRADEPDASPFHPLITEYGHNVGVVDAVGDKFLLVTDEDAPTNRAVLVDPMDPHEYETIIPAKPETLDNVSYVGGKIIATYMKDASNHVYVYDVSGKLEKEIALPGIGTAYGFDGKRADTEVFYTFAGFTTPPTIYQYNLVTNTSSLFHKTEVPFHTGDFVTEQVFYHSKDGTQVPMFLVHKKGLVRNGENPTKLYAYGGFNISLTPYFSPSLIAFLEQGGLYAQPNVRGGGEYGKAWHEAGMKLHKQNVFDDFIAAAEYLFAQKYTSPQKLAIEGASNGGLLIGAVMCQRPDLCKVALPEVGVMDMLRYQKFTIGWGWASEYGTSDDSVDFENLYKYSPLQNLRPGVSYPATLVSTADHDDRVMPAHSFKFIATLQHDQAGPNPTLITIETKAGHGGGKPLSKVINETADKLAFTFYNLGVKVE